MIRIRLGLGIAAGVPVLVLVSLGPTTALAGPPAVAVWAVSAGIGFLMALVFAELASAHPHTTGGIGLLSARVLAPRSRWLGMLAPWSYWFGWSPALAINGALVGTYLRGLLLPGTPSWTALVLAVGVLVACVAVNHLGIRTGARAQLVMVACVVCPLALLVGGAVAGGRFDGSRLLPFEPPGGWASGQGLVAVTGALFIAGWSAYGSELALTYGTEYRGGVRDARGALLLTGGISVAAYALVPLLLVGLVGTSRLQDDPSVALSPLAAGSLAGARTLVGLLIVAVAISLNMVTIASSRVLYQMARSGDAWRALGQVDRRGVPANAMRFDLVFNVALLVAVTALTGGQVANVPVALLAAANVGYFVSIVLALVAGWLGHRAPVRAGAFRLRGWVIGLGLAWAALNVALLVGAGFAWGWSNVLLGVVVLAAAVGLAARTARRAGTTPAGHPTCMAWGAHRRTATPEELMALHGSGRRAGEASGYD